MEKRTIIQHPCPECGEEMETVDMPSSLYYLSACEHCDYKDSRTYKEIEHSSKIQVIVQEGVAPKTKHPQN